MRDPSLAADDLPIVRVEGDLDAHNALAFDKAARRIMRRKSKQAIVDLKDCDLTPFVGPLPMIGRVPSVV